MLPRENKDKVGDIRTSQIRDSEFSKEWEGSYGKVYYHTITLENGDIIKLGKKEKNPAIFLPGNEISYKIVELNNLGKAKRWTHYTGTNYEGKSNPKKTTSKSSSTTKKSTSKSKTTTSRGGKPIKQEDFIGYAMSYAKDLVIAGKTKKTDIDNFKKIFDEIYSVVGDCIYDYEQKLKKN